MKKYTIKQVKDLLCSLYYARHEALIAFSIIRFIILFFISCITLIIYNIIYCFNIIYYKRVLRVEAHIPIFNNMEHAFLEVQNSFKNISKTEEVLVIKSTQEELIVTHKIPKFNIEGRWSFKNNLPNSTMIINAEFSIKQKLPVVLMSLFGKRVFVDYYAYIILKSTQESVDITIYKFIKWLGLSLFHRFFGSLIAGRK